MEDVWVNFDLSQGLLGCSLFDVHLPDWFRPAFLFSPLLRLVFVAHWSVPLARAGLPTLFRVLLFWCDLPAVISQTTCYTPLSFTGECYTSREA